VCNFGNRSLHRLLPRHHDGCGCRNRRPETSLIGASEFDIDLARSYMAGDRYSDLEARMPRVVRPLSLIVHTENAAHPVPQSFFEDTRSSDQAARRLVCTASQDLGLNVSQSGCFRQLIVEDMSVTTNCGLQVE
jgi:histidinol phosphatase-like enzyme